MAISFSFFPNNVQHFDVPHTLTQMWQFHILTLITLKSDFMSLHSIHYILPSFYFERRKALFPVPLLMFSCPIISLSSSSSRLHLSFSLLVAICCSFCLSVISPDGKQHCCCQSMRVHCLPIGCR